MTSIIKSSIRQFVIFVLALGAVLFITNFVHAQTATYPNGNISWPASCGDNQSSTSGTEQGYAITTDSSGNLHCTQIVAVYQ